MVGVRKVRCTLSVCLVLVLLLLLRLLFQRSTVTIPQDDNVPQARPDAEDVDTDDFIQSLVVIIREFEVFDNDVSETVESVQRVCPVCTVLVVSDDAVYPPLQLSRAAHHVILSPSLWRSAADVSSVLRRHHYALLLPDGARLSSPEQLRDLTRLLDAGDSAGVAVAVGAHGLNCQQVSLDMAQWTMQVAATPDSEACDAVEGRAAVFLRGIDLAALSQPWARPMSLSLAIQGALRGWKLHVARGLVLGEGRELLATEHLRWKYETVREERVKQLYGSLGIKKVIGSSQRVEWYGCSRQTPRCFPTVVNDTPSYLHLGRWTPPCCLEGLRATARHVFQALRTCRARWWLEGGSLLGAVRLGDIISWDYDVDIGIYATDIDRCPQLKASRWQTLEDAEGYVWQRGAGYYQVHYSTANRLHVDIFAFTPRDGTMVRAERWNTAHRQDVDFPEHFLRPFSTIQFAGVQAAAPNNVRDFLEYKFGTGIVENPQYPNPDLLIAFNVSLPPPK